MIDRTLPCFMYRRVRGVQFENDKDSCWFFLRATSSPQTVIWWAGTLH